MIQLDLFQKSEDIFMIELQKIKQSSENVRRGVFARVNELERMVLELAKKVEGKDD